VDDRSDEILVASSRRGDKAAYARLVEKHYRHVFAVCLGMLGDVHDAEDIAQDAMVKGLSRISKLTNSERFGPWISQVAKNLCIDLLRRQKRVKPFVAEQPAQPRQAATENHDLRRAIRQLPQELRVPLVMYYFDNRNAKAIAEKLSISHSGACRRIRMAREQLHELLAGTTENEQ
jgi:RNA polymerase sigma-70 factor (ECF subfamily)